MKKLIFLIGLLLIQGCYTPVGNWFRSNFSMSCPNRYEKEIIRDSCNSETIRLKLEEHVWRVQDVSSKLIQMEKQVYEEKLFVNNLYVLNWRGDTAIVIFASNTPTSLKDKDELGRHKYHMIREEKCDCRLCK